MENFTGVTFLVFICVLCWTEANILSRQKRIIGGRPADPPPDANLNNAAEDQTGWGHIQDKPVIFIDDDEQSARIYGASQSKTSDEKKYYAFKGIPYAEPPLNELRFQRPKRRYLEGDISAEKNGQPCLQPSPENPKEVIGDEDCLTLNVYTPRIPSDAGNFDPLPVIFWVHGGGYRRGSGLQYDPGDLVTKETIVVTIQYRLGSLGFLSSNQKDLPGNVGLMDICSALYWVRHYIENFGGDPNKITVAGQGTGASAAMLLSVSKLTSDWVQGVVAMSGSAVSSFAVDSHPKESYNNLTRKSTPCSDKTGVPLVKCLQEVEAHEIIQADSENEEANIENGDFISGLAEVLTPGPVIEGTDDQWSLPNLLEHTAINSLTSTNRTGQIPLLTGVTKKETGSGVKGGFKGDVLNLLANTDNFLKEIMPQRLLHVNTGLLSNSQLGGVLKNLFTNLEYLGGLSKTVETAVSELDKVVQMTTDALFNLPMFLTSKVWSLTGDTYVYTFDHKPQKSTASQFLSGLPLIKGSNQLKEADCSHGEDLIYLFDANSLDGNTPKYQINKGGEDMQIRNMFTSLVAEFARTGAPKLPNSNVNWPKFDAQNSAFMSLSSKPKVDKEFRKCEMALWEGLTEVLSSQKCSALNLGRLLNVEKGLLGGLTGVNSAGKRVTLLGGLGESSGGLVTGLTNPNAGGKPPIVGGLTDPLLGVGSPAKPQQRPSQGLLGLGGQPSKQNNQQQSNGGLLGLGGLKSTNAGTNSQRESTQDGNSKGGQTQPGQKRPGGLLSGGGLLGG